MRGKVRGQEDWNRSDTIWGDEAVGREWELNKCLPAEICVSNI